MPEDYSKGYLAPASAPVEDPEGVCRVDPRFLTMLFQTCGTFVIDPTPEPVLLLSVGVEVLNV